MMDSTDKSGRDEQREDWEDAVRELIPDTTDPSHRVLLLGLPAYSWVTGAVETTVRRVSPGLSMRDDR